jgi:glycosyltransferase involved in cell wall biosynthesis
MDSRIKLFSNPTNQGISYTRNVGIENALGKYIVFVDNDDIILENHLETLYYSDNIPSGTLVTAPHIRESVGKFDYNQNQNTYFIENLVGEEINTDFLFAGPPWSKLFEKKIIIENNIRFKVDAICNEDHIFHLEYLLFIKYYKRIGIGSYIFFTRQHSGGFWYSKYSQSSYKAPIKYMKMFTDGVIEKFQISDSKILLKLWGTPIHAIINYYIFSLYKTPHREPRKKRIILLEEIRIDYNDLLTRFYAPTSILDKMIKKIILLPNIKHVDILLNLAIWIRYSFLKRLFS